MTVLKVSTHHSYSDSDLQKLESIVDKPMTLTELGEFSEKSQVPITIIEYNKEQDIIYIDHPYAY